MGTSWVDLGLSLVALPAVGATGYLVLFTLLARRRPPPPAAPRPARIGVVVPAHDEEAGVAETVKSLLAVEYPRSSFRVIVVADNCRDRTAAVAEAAGAEVLVREDPDRRGKGYALRFAFDHLLARGDVDAVVVVDADTVVFANLLQAFAAHLARGARALQAHYGVRNASESWRTRLLAIAFGAIHGVRSLARERLGLSCGLRGNGMAFSRELLQEVPYQAFSVVEDLEYGIAIAQRGHRVHYVAEAEVLGQMAATAGDSRSQRWRWESGRRAMSQVHLGPLLRKAFRMRSALLADQALDLLVPPAATLVLWSSLGLAACAAASALGASVRVGPWLFGASLAGLVAYGLRGWSLSGVGARGLLDLLLAPVYVAWKLGLRLKSSHHAAGWVRTKRPGER
jgi:cellulose synthase/poly-beta-1,6-N-acetylglucosamine synthase-like glycosyltransferase